MKNIVFLSLLFLVSCVEIKETAVFDQPSNQKEPEGFNGFYSTGIYSDFITQEVWFTQSKKCILVESTEDVKYSGEGALHIKWDKITQTCEWLGIGIGWDSWNGKDVSNILNTAAIEMMVRNKEGSRSSLPLAACLEDYSNGQAWIGFSANAIQADKIGEEWVKVRLPLREFEWDAANGANPTNIKQLLIQFEADGDIYVDDIKIVEFNGSFRKRAILDVQNSEDLVTIDGVFSENEWNEPIMLGNDKVYFKADNEFLYMASVTDDDTPLQNNKTGENIWNGDAIEFAFTTRPVFGKPSPYYKSFNQHFGIKMSKNPIIWDWTKQSEIEGEVSVKKDGDKVNLEAKIPLSYFGDFNFINGEVYGLEIALDKGTLNGRETQVRWNSKNNEGFDSNPTVWGEMIISTSL